MKHSLHHEHFAAWSVLVLVVGVAPLCPERAIAVDTPSWGRRQGETPFETSAPRDRIWSASRAEPARGRIASPPSVPLGCRPS